MTNIITSLFKNRFKAFSQNNETQSDRLSKKVTQASGEISSRYEYLTFQLRREMAVDGVSLNHKLSEYAAGKQILSLSPSESLECLMFNLPRFISAKIEKGDGWNFWNDTMHAQSAIIRRLLRRKLPFDESAVAEMLRLLIQDNKLLSYEYPLSSIVSALERFALENEVSAELGELITQFGCHIIRRSDATVEERRLESRIRRIVENHVDLSIPLNSGEAWSDKAISDINGLPNESKNLWLELLIHCQSAISARPTKKWLKGADEKINAIGQNEFKQMCISWLSLLGKPKTKTLARRTEWESDPNLLFDDGNADVIKGLAWCCSLNEDAEIARELIKVGLLAFKKVPGHGAKSTRVGNAVIFALSAMPGKQGLYQLAVLKVKVRYRQALSLIEKSLLESAKREGLTIDELSEIGIPGFGMEDVGYCEEVLGEHAALIKVNGFHNAELLWRKPDGKTQKSVPANVKEHFPQELKEIKGNIKDIKFLLSVQKERLEQLFLKELSWTFDTWQERYLNHPIVGIFSRKLIWCFESEETRELAIYNGDYLETAKGKKIDTDIDGLRVSLWHPIHSQSSEIKSWRNRLVEMELTQPFKQAHREVYLLTDAEINTNVYSNRFASHIIKQHQFNALAAARNWKYTLQGCWDGGNEELASIKLDKFNLYAEFWVHGIGEYGADTSESGIFLYVSTDQVRFYHQKPDVDQLNEQNTERDRPVPLDQIPPLVLSEVFRDVDLYVGVCSVGNDPEWSDGGSESRYRDYWNSFSFGELSATAITRKEILENLIPKLQFGKKCKFVDRFLVVEGKRRIYKIHMGSGNILMEPNNQYLCIVPDSKKKKQDVFLPFEGDNTLSIILSKAALLANDEKIKDSTINSQINNF